MDRYQFESADAAQQFLAEHRFSMRSSGVVPSVLPLFYPHVSPDEPCVLAHVERGSTLVIPDHKQVLLRTYAAQLRDAAEAMRVPRHVA